MCCQWATWASVRECNWRMACKCCRWRTRWSGSLSRGGHTARLRPATCGDRWTTNRPDPLGPRTGAQPAPPHSPTHAARSLQSGPVLPHVRCSRALLLLLGGFLLGFLLGAVLLAGLGFAGGALLL